MAAKTLRLTFKNAAGNNVSLSVDNPKDTLTPAEVSQAMADIIAQNQFTSAGGDLVEAVDATIITQSDLV